MRSLVADRESEGADVRRNVESWERWGSVAGGAALLYWAARHGHTRRLTGTAGTALLARGLSGYCPVTALVARGSTDTRVALAGPRAINVRESVIIARPAAEVFAYWRDLSRLPLVMRHLVRVTVIDARRSHWVVRGPLDATVEWDAEIISEREPDLVAWRTYGDADVVNAGSVHFRAIGPHRTEVLVRLQYQPVGGHLAAWFSMLLGVNPARQIREDLERLQQALEARAGLPAPEPSASLQPAVL